MATTQELYTQSLLAQAAYAKNLAKGTLDTSLQLAALKDPNGGNSIRCANSN